MASAQKEPAIPGPEDRALAEKSSQKLAAVFGKQTNESPVTITVDDGETIILPFSAMQHLLHILSHMAQGNAITLIPIHAYLTTQEAADLLHISRPYFIKLLEKGAIPFEKVGSHRRIKAEDLFKYQAQAEEDKKQALDELIRQAQELDLGY
jgi:excisionase family DNA binding protein